MLFNIENQNQEKVSIDTYKIFMRLNVIKNLIKDSITVENDEVRISSVFFNDNLIKLIKYTDEEFYNELKGN